MSRIIYKYSGKPAKQQEVKTAYTKLTDGRFIVPGPGWLHTMMYVNLSHKKEAEGGIRHVLVRENPTDETCFSDLAVTKKLVSKTNFLMQPTWFGAVGKGRPFHWALRRSTELGTTQATTRYAKWLWLSADLAAAPSPSRSGEPLLLLPSSSEVSKIFARYAEDEDGDEPVEISL